MYVCTENNSTINFSFFGMCAFCVPILWFSKTAHIGTTLYIFVLLKIVLCEGIIQVSVCDIFISAAKLTYKFIEIDTEIHNHTFIIQI